MDLSGKTALVTGATSGIGMEAAAALAARGAHVILGVRNVTAGKDVVANIQKRFPHAKVECGPPLDLVSQDSVRSFAAEINAKYPKLHILINNAGVSFMKKEFTSDNVGVIAQTNHLGPYTLTRLLEKKLIDSKARVVTVASILHRMVTMKDAMAFLTDWRSGYYEHSKLANVLFGYELQRRLGPLGVQSVVADPGGVRSNLWDKSPIFKAGLYRSIINACYSPPEDGTQSLVHAATVKWEKEKKAGTAPSEDLRYYARGLFRSPLICKLQGLRGKRYSFMQNVEGYVWGISSTVLSLMDWPLRRLSGGVLFSKTAPVSSSKFSYQKKIAAELWDASATVAKVPKEVQA